MVSTLVNFCQALFYDICEVRSVISDFILETIQTSLAEPVLRLIGKPSPFQERCFLFLSFEQKVVILVKVN